MFARIFWSHMPAYKSCLAIGLSLLLPSLQARNGSATPRQQSSAPNSAAVAPELFSPGVIPGPANDGSPTFSPDGNTLFFTRSTANWGAILESHKLNGQWSQPALASFSGEWPDSSPSMAPDGTYVVFQSTRPAVPLTVRPKEGEPIKGVVSNLW